MLGLFEKKKQSRKITVENLLLENPHHEWRRSEKIYYRFFKELLSQLDKEVFSKMNSSRQLCFLYSDGYYASTFPSDDNYHFIVIYPELLKLMRSVDNSHAFAILFHEFGHIINEDHKSMTSALEQEIKADHFATNHGHGIALLEFLESKPRTFDVIKRIDAITKELENSH